MVKNDTTILLGKGGGGVSDLIVGLVQTAVLTTLIAVFSRAAIINKNILIYKLIAGAFGCHLLGVLFWLPYFYIMGNWPADFSAADLSFIGYYCFMISANLSLIEKWTPERKTLAKKHRLIAISAPIVTLLFHIVYVIQAGKIVNNIIVFIPLAIWSYITLLSFLSSGRSPERVYYGAVMLVLVLELLIYFASSDFITVYYILAYAQMAGWVLILPAVNKAVK